MADVSRRMLSLLSLLQTGRTWAGADLAARLDVSPLTLRRDADRLRQLGYPVETRSGPGGHYRLVAGTAMPPLLLDDDEAVAVAIGLRIAAQSSPATGDHSDDPADRAMAKLDQVLPSRLQRKAAAIRESMETTPTTGAPVPVRLVSMIGTAIQQHERLRFDYQSREGERTARRVDPHRQVLLRNRWYLVAWDVDRDDWRTFRLDRIFEASTTGHGFTARELPAETAVGYLDAAFNANRHRAEIVFLAPVDRVADRIVGQHGTLEPLDDHRCRYTTWVDSFEWLAVTTTIVGIDFHVEEPADFRNYCATLRDRLDRAASSR